MHRGWPVDEGESVRKEVEWASGSREVGEITEFRRGQLKKKRNGLEATVVPLDPGKTFEELLVVNVHKVESSGG